MLEFKSIGTMTLGFLLRSGVLDPVLKSVSDVAGGILKRVDSLVNDVRVIWKHKVATGEAPRDKTFGEFFTEYFNGVAADSIDGSHVDAQVITGAAVNLLVGMVGSTSKYWTDSLRDLDGFSKSPLGDKFHGFATVTYEQVKPVVQLALERIRRDLAAARSWEEAAAGQA